MPARPWSPEDRLVDLVHAIEGQAAQPAPDQGNPHE
jgi:hypothetical protein